MDITCAKETLQGLKGYISKCGETPVSQLEQIKGKGAYGYMELAASVYVQALQVAIDCISQSEGGDIT